MIGVSLERKLIRDCGRVIKGTWFLKGGDLLGLATLKIWWGRFGNLVYMNYAGWNDIESSSAFWLISVDYNESI
jgi:hypothetical protein